MSALFIFILAVHVLLAVALVITVLLQRSEGGVLGIGGSGSGLMTARGAADLLTTATRWLATGFVITSIALAAIAARDRKETGIADELDKKASVEQSVPAKTKPASSGVPEVPVPNMDLRNLQLPGAEPAAPSPAEVPAPAK